MRKLLRWMQALVLLALWIVVCALPAEAYDEVRYYHTDALGSVAYITDEQGNVVERFEYEPYGRVGNQPTRNGPGFTGHVADGATGLVNMQQRYYSPLEGRFLSVDPVTAWGGDLRHFNNYAYAYDNPYRYTDPDGRCPSCIGAGVGAGLEILVQSVEIGFGMREEFSGRDILISGAAGATGVGLGRLIARSASLGKLAQYGLNRASDAATSAGSQLAKDGEVSLEDTIIDVTAGATAGHFAGLIAGSTSSQSVTGRLLERQANRAERVAAGSQRAGRQEAAVSARAAQQEHVNGSAAAASVSSSNAASSAEKVRCTVGGGGDC